MTLKTPRSDLRAKDIMSENPITISPTDSLMTAWQHMNDNDIKHLIVVENSRICGILSDRDILCEMHFHEDMGHLKPNTVEYAMNPDVVTARDHEPLSVVVKLMIEHEIHSVIISNELYQPVGIITDFDLLCLMDRSFSPELRA